MDHDQIWKEVLTEFFGEFMELFFPRIAEQLDLTTVEFDNTELFADPPTGDVRRPDLVAEVACREGGRELILIHVEVQSCRDPEMDRRMWEYYCLLRVRRKLPVLPIVLYLAPGRAGLVRETYREQLFGQTYCTLRYWAVALPSFSAERFLRSRNLLAPALSALMRPGRLRRPVHKLQALDAVAAAETNEARRYMLAGVVGAYMVLSEVDEAEFEQLAAREPNTGVATMVNIFEQKGIEKGIEKGIQQGIEKGIAEGLLAGQRRSLLGQMTSTFGELPGDVRARVAAIDDPERLDVLLVAILKADTLEQMTALL